MRRHLDLEVEIILACPPHAAYISPLTSNCERQNSGGRIDIGVELVTERRETREAELWRGGVEVS